MTGPSDLVAYLCDSQPHLLGAALVGAALLGWMEASPRFTAFVETYQDFLRLNGIVLWSSSPPASGQQGQTGPLAAFRWNKPARPAFDEKLLRRVSELLSGRLED